MDDNWVTVDGNEAAARIAFLLSEVIAIYPITPASPMAELCDEWAGRRRQNLWGVVPEVVEMQSEAGAAGAMHGVLIRGGLGSTFTASQGLLLMLPDMFKISGELLPGVIHVAARTVATHALSIFGDHSDVMAVRSAGWGMLASTSVQEAQDLALIAHAAALESRVPFVHFFDGFRTSHEINKIKLVGEDIVAAMVDDRWVADHRLRGLEPEHPVLKGSSQNPDVFFQSREAANPFYMNVPAVVAGAMDRLATLTGRRYGVVEYCGSPEAERVIVMMGSGCGAAEEAVEALTAEGERVGLAKIRLFRPFPAEELAAVLPPTVTKVAVLDRTKEPGAPGEPLYQDVATALYEAHQAGTRAGLPRIIHGRYGLSSKEFTPAMAKAVLDEAAGESPKGQFTVGINDDLTHLSIRHDDSFSTDRSDLKAVFFGLGSDGTVSANKATVKIIGENTDFYAQGYFVYDSKKAGATTVSHLRFSSEPIRSTYLIREANFVACHQFNFLERMDVLAAAAPGATVLLNSPYPAGEVWTHLPLEVQQEIIDKGLELWVVDGHKVAEEAGLGGRINSVMQTCFFALAGILERERAIKEIKRSIEKTYAKRGSSVVEMNLAAVDAALAGLQKVDVPAVATSSVRRRPPVPADAPDFVKRVTASMLEGKGDLLPVSAMPVDGSYPLSTARYEKRRIAREIPIWDPPICIDCAKCAIVCPHAAIRMKVFPPAALEAAPEGFRYKEFRSREVPGMLLSIQVAPEDCTGCGVCVDVCPAKSKTAEGHKALNMEPVGPHLDRERRAFDFFLSIPEASRSLMAPDSLKGSQIRQPLFEFSGACAGCGETPYLKLLTQLFGDRILVANATGCSSIYGGNLPTTPWCANAEGKGPAWANSLFEDNAEFGLGMRLALDRQKDVAKALLADLRSDLGPGFEPLLEDGSRTDLSNADIEEQRRLVSELKKRLATLTGGVDGSGSYGGGRGGNGRAVKAARLLELADSLIRKSVWIVGGDGWAYDIGSGGLDHVLASGRDVNILVLDTEVYSNTGGQASKATPRGAVAKFAATGKRTPKKDLGAEAMAYGNVYVAQVAIGANDIQTVKAFVEAEAWHGPSLIIAYSTCIAHGIDMGRSMSHQKDLVKSGYWPLYRYHPRPEKEARPFQLDSKEPSVKLAEVLEWEGRFEMLRRTAPERAEELFELAQADVDERWRYYSQLTGIVRSVPATTGEAR